MKNQNRSLLSRAGGVADRAGGVASRIGGVAGMIGSDADRNGSLAGPIGGVADRSGSLAAMIANVAGAIGGLADGIGNVADAIARVADAIANVADSIRNPAGVVQASGFQRFMNCGEIVTIPEAQFPPAPLEKLSPMNDYIPDSFANRLAWLQNLKVQITAEAAALGWPAAKLAGFMALLDPLIAAYQALADADAAFDKASGDAQDLFANSSASLRATLAEIKTNPAFTDGMGAVMQIFTSGSATAPDTIKPSLVATAARGYVRLTGSKNHAETVNLYMRRKGAAWILIAPKRKRFPFDDQTPLATPGVPEEREYMARGVIGDDEIGQDSDIVSAVFGG
jgi:hypothetical protein